MISYGRQTIEQQDLDAVVEVLKSNWLTQGPNVAKFENSVCEYVSAEYGIAVNSATSGLHITYLALGLGAGDYLWTTPNTFVATANTALHCGAQVDFIDISISDYNLDINKLEQKLINAQQENKLPKIVTPVHFAGLSCDMQRLRELSVEYGFYIVEDASHAIGGKYKNNFIGSCEYSDFAIFSFHPVKIITTGEGGMIMTNNANLAAKVRKLRSHGITRDEKEYKNPIDGRWNYEQIEIGFNYRMPDINAILGFSQVQRLSNFVQRRNQIADKYRSALQELDIGYQLYNDIDKLNSYHLFVILLDSKQERYEIDKFLFENGYSSQVHYYPVYLQPYYRDLGFKEGLCPVAENYYSRCLSIPIFPTLANNDVDKIIELITKFKNIE